MAIDKRFSNVRPRHPRGGPDGGRDIEAIFNGAQRAFGAVGFINQANDSEENKRKAANKYKEDAASAISADPKPDVLIFFTNVNLTVSEKDELITHAKNLGFADSEIYDRERMRLSLDNPDGLSIRFQYLKIPLSEAEQATFFARWGDDIQSMISDGFGRIERILNRIHFLHEADMPLDRITIIFELDKKYTLKEIGHFRMFASFCLERPMHGVSEMMFGVTNSKTRNYGLDSRADIDESWPLYGMQWDYIDEATGKDESSVNDDESEEQVDMYNSMKTSGHVWDGESNRIAAVYTTESVFGMGPALRLKDIDGVDVIFFVNKEFSKKIKIIHVYANQYKVDEIFEDGFRVDEKDFEFIIPIAFKSEELEDDWVRIRPSSFDSCFSFRFSQRTPKRFFEPEETVVKIQI
ncbi:hypothetical protein [Azospirillum brasilense]|uniref:hypothetical protein n=1 Tax=Azospirillum brasilense TaxID=192 RepID=UPI001EDA2FA1|nr:hypothetical protein [Azospirillum brasilense]UKJ74488.1 hypothetical protein H1Q64_18170 [Azospirillum brasilense]